jgi:late competence protein required for DNA uptake (superfamily II DNA/RNA helicase)
MAEVIQLPVKKKRAFVEPNAARYYCTRCGGDDCFQLLACGTVMCTHCNVVMQNLRITKAETP